MRVRDVMAALGRRWWVLLIGLLGTGGLLFAVYQYVPSTYQITSRVLLLPPESTVLDTGNPFLQLGGLREAVDMLGVSLADQSTLLELEKTSKDATVEVGADPTGAAPILLISIQDPSPDAARQIRDRLLSLVDIRLDSIQQGIGVPVSNRVTSTIISSDVEAEVVGNNRLRAFVAAGGVGLALTMTLAVIVDAALLRRRERRRRVEVSDAAVPAADEPTERGRTAPHLAPEPASLGGSVDGSVSGADVDPDADLAVLAAPAALGARRRRTRSAR